MELTWRWYTFKELTTKNLYAILRLRQEIFIVEQQCAYQDCDNLDTIGWHLVGWQQSGEEDEAVAVAYLRVIPPATTEQLPRIGRLLTHSTIRKRGIGAQLIKKALSQINLTHQESAVQISAQLYLVNFYEKYGFQPTSEAYEEDNIPHVEMVYTPANCKKGSLGLI